MKPARFQYHRPTQLHEALEMVATLQNYKILAGGQSLMPMMNFRFVMPDHVIDMNQVSELTGIHEVPGRLEIGAMTRQHDIHRSALVAKLCPLVPEAYDQVSHRQIRNRGTLGGSLCHLDPASEQPCFTSALDGEIEVHFVDLAEDRRVDPDKEGAVILAEEPTGPKMGHVVLKRGHQALLPANAAYQFRARQTGVLLQQALEGENTIYRWKDICYS